MDLLAPLVLTGTVLLGLFFTASVIWRNVAGLSYVSPPVVFLGSVLIRVCGGIWLQVMQPMSRVLAGEYDQYVIARRYINEVSWLWLIFVCGVLSVLWLARGSIRRSARQCNNDNSSRDFFLKEKIFLLNGQDGRELVANTVAVSMIFFALEGVIGIITGSTDRGEQYSYWAQQAFKPVSLFVGLSRLKQLSYFLVPMCLVGSRNKVKRYLLGVLAAVNISPGIINGSRGELLYPFVMLMLGSVVALKASKRAVIASMIIIGLMFPVVPYIAAYRDNPGVNATSSRDLAGRIGLLINGVSRERFEYRLSALGREIYACSDAFLFKPENVKTRIGFDDLDIGMVRRMLVPRLMSSKKDFEKLDGSNIAQDLMGTQIKGWFPCISTPADLWRRGGPVTVFLGGTVVGLLMVVFQLLWIRQLRSRNSMFAVFCVGFPATYYQFPLSGTVREVMWLVCWEVVKYIAAFLVITRVAGALIGLRVKGNVGTRR